MLQVIYNQQGKPVGLVNTALSNGSFVGQIPSFRPDVGGNHTNVGNLNAEANGLVELAAMHDRMLCQQSMIATGVGNKKIKEPTQIVERPWLQEPDGSVGFDPEMSIVIPAIGTTATVVSHTVPVGYDGVINYFSWNFIGGGFVQGSGDIVVQLLRNGTPIRNYDNIVTEKGSVENPRKISPLRIYSGQVISLVVTHVANVLLNGNIVASLTGYDYPSEG